MRFKRTSSMLLIHAVFEKNFYTDFSFSENTKGDIFHWDRFS